MLSRDNLVRLSRREIDVILCLCDGLPDKQTAHSLGIKRSTVIVVMQRIFRGLGVYCRIDVVLWAIQHQNALFKREWADKGIQRIRSVQSEVRVPGAVLDEAA